MAAERVRGVPALSGWQWIARSMQLFARAPIRWLALNLALLFIAYLLAQVPVIGALLFAVLTPVFAGGLTLGCQDVEIGRPLVPAHLFAGFRINAAALVTIGGVYVVGQIIVFGILTVVGGADLQALLQALLAERSAPLPPTIGDRVLVSVLLAAALLVPLAMAVWFAPILAVLEAQPALRALRLSLQAGLRNLRALSVYGIAMAGLLIGLLFAVRSLLATLPAGLAGLREPVAMLVTALWLSLTLLSAYVGYRDIFAPAP
jgi:hypothetical protein